jgi:hypothetical protein
MAFIQRLRFTRNRGRRLAVAALGLLIVGVGIAVPSSATAAASQPTASSPVGTLTVMVITTSGQKLALENVVVDLSGPQQPAVTRLTDASGQTTFAGLPEGAQYTVKVSQRGDHGVWTRLSNSAANVTVDAGQHHWLALRMRLAGSIGGRIVNQSGVPVGNTMVRADGAATGSSAYDYTDFDGYYVIRGLASDNYRVAIVDKAKTLVIRRVVPVLAQQNGVAQTAVDYINGVLQQPYPTTPDRMITPR